MTRLETLPFHLAALVPIVLYTRQYVRGMPLPRYAGFVCVGLFLSPLATWLGEWGRATHGNTWLHPAYTVPAQYMLLGTIFRGLRVVDVLVALAAAVVLFVVMHTFQTPTATLWAYIGGSVWVVAAGLTNFHMTPFQRGIYAYALWSALGALLWILALDAASAPHIDVAYLCFQMARMLGIALAVAALLRVEPMQAAR